MPAIELDLEPRRRTELMAAVNLALVAILMLSLWSYSPTDLSAQSGGIDTGVSNWIGRPGAWLAVGLRALLGNVAYALPALIFLGGVLGFGRDNQRAFWLKSVALVVLLSSFCALLYLTIDQSDTTAVFQAGGVCGYYFGRLMLTFGSVGSYVILVTLIVCSLLLGTNILFGEIARRTLHLARNSVRVRIKEEETAPRRRVRAEPEERAGWLGLRRKRARPALPEPAPDPEPEVEVEDKPDESAAKDEREAGITLDDAEDEEEHLILSLDGPPPPLPEAPPAAREAAAAPPVTTGPNGRPRRPVRDETPAVTVDEEETPERTPELIISTKMTQDLVDWDEPVEVAEEEEEEDAEPVRPAKSEPEPKVELPFQLPSLSLLDPPPQNKTEVLREEIERTCSHLKRTFEEFNISARVVEVNYGPVITRYQIAPPPGIRLSRISGLADNLAMNLKAESVRVEAPIPGKGTVGIEVPNKTRVPVCLSEVLASDAFRKHKSRLRMALGKTIEGEPFVADLASMPHLLIAGATGAGKSVCINTIISGILYTNTPDEVKFLMVDPKRVELQLYAGIPHLLYPVITDPKLAGGVLKWAVGEMEKRYDCLSRLGVRSLPAYNAKRKAEIDALRQRGGKEPESRRDMPATMPYIVLIIDELADLMMVCRADVEASVQRLAQMARAVGIHLVLATQRPSVNVITGVIKANLPTRIAFQVSSKIDSRTILDENGAEALLGKGDMLFRPGGAAKPVRVQGAFVSTEEVERVVDFICDQRGPDYQEIELDIPEDDEEGDVVQADDDLYEEAVQIVLEHDAASTSLLQRRLKIGYGRAARLLDIMEAQGIVGPARGSKPREVLSSGVR